MRSLVIVTCFITTLFLLPGHCAYALTFNFIYDSNFDYMDRLFMGIAGHGWETLLKDDVTVNVYVKWGNSSEMQGKTGNTALNMVYMDYSLMRDRMEADESQESNRNGLVRWLPTQNQFRADIQLYDPNNPVIFATQANWKALGLNGTHFFNGGEDKFGNRWNDTIDATITFNPEYFDGTEPSDRHFITVARHELGHVLGFMSMIDTPLTAGPTTLDMFRFEKDSLHNDDDDDIPTTLGEFRLNERNLSSEGVVPYLVTDFDTTSGAFTKYMMANSRHDREASHWFDLPDGQEIGIMDPAYDAYNTYNLFSIADAYAMDLIGWEVDDTYIGNNLDWNEFELSGEISIVANTTMDELWGILMASIEIETVTISEYSRLQSLLTEPEGFINTDLFITAYQNDPTETQDAVIEAILAYNSRISDPTNYIPFLWNKTVDGSTEFEMIDYHNPVPGSQTGQSHIRNRYRNRAEDGNCQ